MATPIQTLELRSIDIPRTDSLHLLEQKLGRAVLSFHRHHLAPQPLHCGDILELYRDGEWVQGRYEWTGNRQDLPTFHTEQKIFELNGACLLRWPSDI